MNIVEEFFAVNPPPDWWPSVARDLKAPFPWFGGKSKIADLVWERFGPVKNYVEPFYATGAVLLGRPDEPVIETGNDLDGFVVNFWRAVQANPDAVAEHCDWPVFELDLHSRHKWLVAQRETLRDELMADPDYYDAKIAGWWVWGLCAWIGSGWCAGGEGARLPSLQAGSKHGGQRHGKGVHSKSMRLPHLGAGSGGEDNHACAHYGKGVHGKGARGLSQKLPDIGCAGNGNLYGRGVHGKTMRSAGQLPSIGSMVNANGTGGDGSKGINTKANRSKLGAIMQALANRLRYVRFTCGDALRVLSDAVTWRHGLTGILIDPPYPPDAGCTGDLYVGGKGAERDVFDRVFRRAVELGARKDCRIAFCYYDGTTIQPVAGNGAPAHGPAEDVSRAFARRGWDVVSWKARGGYGGQSATNENAARERVAFSPHCLKARQTSLF